GSGGARRDPPLAAGHRAHELRDAGVILTRPFDSPVVKAAQGLRFLVFDELHTYRGRQGADVALLVRRVREHAASPALPTPAPQAEGRAPGHRASSLSARTARRGREGRSGSVSSGAKRDRLPAVSTTAFTSGSSGCS